MKTARFSAVVETAGRPKSHLVLVAPEKDKVLQAAIRTGRVLTLHQTPTGGKADYGAVGFELGAACQYLIFPKSLSKFRERRIIGITYELLETGVSDNEAKSPHPRPVPAPRRRRSARDSTRPKPVLEKVVQFARPEPPLEPDEEGDTIREIKNQVRRAMEVLKQGHQAAAFNLLKRIVDS